MRIRTASAEAGGSESSPFPEGLFRPEALLCAPEPIRANTIFGPGPVNHGDIVDNFSRRIARAGAREFSASDRPPSLG